MTPLPHPLHQTFTDIAVEIDPETVLMALHRGHRARHPDMNAEMHTAVNTAHTLIRPAAALVWVRVDRVEGQQVTLSSEIGFPPRTATLTLGPHADLMSAAQMALISVGTIGDDLDGAVAELNAKGDLLGSYFLDSAGVVALAEVGRAVRERAEAEAERLGWGVSPSLGPGTLAGWPLEEQRDLWPFLEDGAGDGAAALGVVLSESGVIKPHKSATGLIGLGAGYRTRRVGSVCGFCQLHHTCWRRRRNEAEAAATASAP
jgi:hypothetical protein